MSPDSEKSFMEQKKAINEKSHENCHKKVNKNGEELEKMIFMDQK